MKDWRIYDCKRDRTSFEKVSSILDDVECETTALIDEAEDYRQENEDMRQSLYIASQYYNEFQKEIRFLIQLCHDNAVVLPLEGHFIDINEAVPKDDPQKGSYDVPWEDLESFIS